MVRSTVAPCFNCTCVRPETIYLLMITKVILGIDSILAVELILP